MTYLVEACVLAAACAVVSFVLGYPVLAQFIVSIGTLCYVLSLSLLDDDEDRP